MAATTETRVLKICLAALVLIMLVIGLGAGLRQRSYQKQLIALQNQLATQSTTIEEQKDLYARLTVQTQNIQGSLDQKDAQVKELEAQLKKQGDQLLAASSLVVQWKKAYEGLAQASQTPVTGPTAKPTVTSGGQPATREKVDFHRDFGYVIADGWTLTNPPEAWVRLSQGRPLRLTLALSQGKDKVWHTYATSSEDNIGVDIRVTSVDPYVLQPKWYEHIGIDLDAGLGTTTGGIGGLFGAGLSYQFSKFTLGPHVWFGIGDTVSKFYGLSMTWRPFQKTN